MNRLLLPAWIVAVLFAFAGPATAGDLKIEMANGRVTIQAHDVTIREILAEWARVGQAKVVNGDKIAGGPVTLELTNVPERQALDTILRSVPGYIAAPRNTQLATASVYDRIMILAVTRASAPAGSGGASTMPAAVGRPQPSIAPPPPVDDDEPNDVPPPPMRGQPGQPPGPPGYGVQPPAPGQPSPTTTSPGYPAVPTTPGNPQSPFGIRPTPPATVPVTPGMTPVVPGAPGQQPPTVSPRGPGGPGGRPGVVDDSGGQPGGAQPDSGEPGVARPGGGEPRSSDR